MNLHGKEKLVNIDGEIRTLLVKGIKPNDILFFIDLFLEIFT
jgi:hypothetical protein